MKRIPLNALQAGIFKALSAHQTTKIYDNVPKNPTLPYLTLGAFTCRDSNTSKRDDIANVSIQIHIWSEYEGRKEVNSIANDVIQVLSVVQVDLSPFGFKNMSQGVTMFEAFDTTEDGYGGVITVDFIIQNLGG